MSGMQADPGPRDEPPRDTETALEGLVGVDEAAQVLGVPHQTLFRLFELSGVSVRRLQVGRRRLTMLSVDDLRMVRDALGRVRPEPPSLPAERDTGATWVRARQLEAWNGELEFQRRLLEVQLATTRALQGDAERDLAKALTQVEALRGRLERAEQHCDLLERERLTLTSREEAIAEREADLDRRACALAERESRLDALERALDAARAELTAAGEDLGAAREDARAARATIGLERDARTRAETERDALRASLAVAQEVERSTQRYCDRLERRMRALTEGLRPSSPAERSKPDDRPGDQGPSAHAS